MRLLLLSLYFPCVFLSFINNGGEPGRIIGIFGDLYFQYYPEAFRLYFVACIVVTLPLLTVRKVKIERKMLTLPLFVYLAVFAAFLLGAVVAYPWAFHLSGSRQSLLPGGAWNVFYLVSYLILYVAAEKRYRLVLATCVLVALFIAAAGERADSIFIILTGVLGALGIEIDAPRWKLKLSRGKMITIGIAGAMLFILLVAIGNYRESQQFQLDIPFKDVVAQDTVVDASHVFFSSMVYRERLGLDWRPLEHLVYSLIPFHPLSGADSELSPTSLLLPLIPNKGGGLWITSFYMSGGWFGVIFGAMVVGLGIRQLLVGKHKLWAVLFLMVVLLGPRSAWYGIYYLNKPLYVLAAAFLFFYYFKFTNSTIPTKRKQKLPVRWQSTSMEPPIDSSRAGHLAGR